MSQAKTAISPTRAEDFPEWYQQVIRAADLAENSPVRGCMIIKPYGYALWENMQRIFDGMIKDAGFFKFLEENAHHLNTKAFEKEDTLRAALKLWQTIVAESAKIKAEVVEKDEKEAKLRMILNFGHTFGHAIESLTHYRSYNHGEAVAIGMVAAALVAQKIGILEPNVTARLSRLLDKLGLPSEIKNFQVARLMAGINIDKKVLGGKVNFVLPEKLGKVVIRDNVPAQAVKKVLIELGAK